jgi:hypothetical protein
MTIEAYKGTMFKDDVEVTVCRGVDIPGDQLRIIVSGHKGCQMNKLGVEDHGAFTTTRFPVALLDNLVAALAEVQEQIHLNDIDETIKTEKG